MQASGTRTDGENYRQLRNTLLTVEYVVPIAVLGFAIQNGWLSSLPNIGIVDLFLYFVNRMIHDHRADYEKRLKLIREEITNLPKTKALSTS